MYGKWVGHARPLRRIARSGRACPASVLRLRRFVHDFSRLPSCPGTRWILDRSEPTFVIEYRIGNNLDLDVVIELYHASTLGERRPVNDRERMGEMLRNANLVITAWDGKLLVGISRSLTDFTYA